MLRPHLADLMMLPIAALCALVLVAWLWMLVEP
jgi:hypothetical protein